MGSPVPPIVANLYVVEQRALSSFTGTAPSHWFRYVDDAWVKIQTKELNLFLTHFNNKDKYVKFAQEDLKKKIAWPSWTVESRQKPYH